MKDTLTDLTAIAGAALIVTAGFLVSLPLGLAALGAALLALAGGLARVKE